MTTIETLAETLDELARVVVEIGTGRIPDELVNPLTAVVAAAMLVVAEAGGWPSQGSAVEPTEGESTRTEGDPNA